MYAGVPIDMLICVTPADAVGFDAFAPATFDSATPARFTRPRVGYLHDALIVEQQIFRFDVAMNQAVIVRELQPARGLQDVSHGRFRIELAGLLQKPCERLAFDEFHAEEVRLVSLGALDADVVDLDDVVVRELCGGVRFSREAGDELWIIRQLRSENFQRDVAIE